MYLTVPVALFGWIPVVLILFATLPGRRAAIVAFIGGFLFLPNYSYEIAGFPDLSKSSVTSIAVLLGIFLFDIKRLLPFKPRWFDMPMFVYCLSPLVTSVLNELGIYNGLSNVLTQFFTWGVPYLAGRIYLNTLDAMYDFAVGIVVGGLIYVPLSLWEVRMSPQLHDDLYGFRARPFHVSERGGGYRPSVFLWTYIPVAVWLSFSTLTAFWMWKCGRLRSIFGLPILVLVGALSFTLLLTKTLTGLILLLVAVTVLLSDRIIRKPRLLTVLVLAIPLVIGFRATGTWSGEAMVSLAAQISDERARSLQFRVTNENQLAARALERPFFGWGGFGRARIYDESGRDISTTDGLWIILLGNHGLIGMFAMLGTYLLPLLRFARTYPSGSLANPEVAPAAVAAALILMGLINNVPNYTLNPVVQLAIGGVLSLTALGQLKRQ